MDIYIATSNPHKAAEFSAMFAGAGIGCRVLSAADVPGFVPPVEDGTTFAENALIKARSLAKKAPRGAYVMADDSGIVVDALGGAPGIMSARYAGVSGAGADAANNRKLLRELENVPDEKRTARFVCAIALVCPDGSERVFSGKIEGVVGRAEKGLGGFGYDPLFFLPERGMTTAEIPAAEKNSVSHRGRAFAALAEFLKTKIS